jgi:hypothetical protein
MGRRSYPAEQLCHLGFEFGVAEDLGAVELAELAKLLEPVGRSRAHVPHGGRGMCGPGRGQRNDRNGRARRGHVDRGDRPDDLVETDVVDDVAAPGGDVTTRPSVLTAVCPFEIAVRIFGLALRPTSA